MAEPPHGATHRDAIELVVHESVATITINRADKANALTWSMVGELRDAVAKCRTDESVRAVVITGAGDRAFCAGADLNAMATTSSAGAETAPDPTLVHEGRGQLAELFLDLDELGKPTIARVRGFALAGGFGLAMACDIVVAASDAIFGAPEINVGLWPFMISVPLLRSLPPKVALELMMTGRRIDALEAQRLGCINAVVEPDELDASVQSYTDLLVTKPPQAMRLGRTAFYDVLGVSARQALGRLHPLLSVVASGDEAREGIAAFAERRTPSWAAK